ncbi:ATP-dependent RNA helicase DDX19A [Camelus dromedarius]|uniref:RNA helicase n=1 Tax=Camelus dromedarius TaxID=9838 RepID=A0A5N4DS47_CAMDR|nr:ATP-dependent RNA helicase DDX19A [Camelus dromedarius]
MPELVSKQGKEASNGLRREGHEMPVLSSFSISLSISVDLFHPQNYIIISYDLRIYDNLLLNPKLETRQGLPEDPEQVISHNIKTDVMMGKTLAKKDDGISKRGQKISEHIVIGTPGTVLDWCSKLKFIDPKKIKVFVLDEADVMIATQGHQDQSIRIQRMLPRNCQMLLFSATFEDSVWKFAQKVVPDPNIIKLKREEETLDTIKQYYVLCNNRDEKFQALCNLYGAITIAQAMIFCHTRKTASWLAAELSKEGHQVALLSGEMVVEQRAAVIERFREGKEKVLVTTNVCARGIDVEQVSVVINFDLPVDKDGNPDNETYLHRIGRTGRFGKRGLAVNMVDSKHSMNILNRIQEHFNKKIERLDTDDLDEIEKIAN